MYKEEMMYLTSRQPHCVVYVSMDAQYRLVETYNALDVSKVNPKDKTSTTVERQCDTPWYRNGLIISSYVPTSALNQIPCLKNIESAVINANKLRQLAPGQTEDGYDIGGFHVVSDVGEVCLCKYPKAAYKWAKQIDPTLAPSIKWIDSGNQNVISMGVLIVSSSIFSKEKKLRIVFFGWGCVGCVPALQQHQIFYTTSGKRQVIVYYTATSTGVLTAYL